MDRVRDSFHPTGHQGVGVPSGSRGFRACAVIHVGSSDGDGKRVTRQDVLWEPFNIPLGGRSRRGAHGRTRRGRRTR